MKELEGKVAIVTGASSGIGLSIAELYAKNGAAVVLADIQDKQGQAAAAAITQQGHKAIYQHCDVSKPEDCKVLVETAVKEFGGLHIACNNAGIGGEMAATADYPIDAWQQVMNVNLNGVFYGMKYQIPAMLQAGGGSIVNISSILGQVGFPNASAYTTTKHGMVGLTKSAALEYGTAGIRVNTVGPAFIRTPMLTALDEEVLQNQLAPQHALNRLGEPNEVAELVLWLSSERASFATGGYYPVDGGFLAH